MRLMLILFLLLPAAGFSQLIKDSYGSSGNIIGEVKEKTRLVSKLTWEISGTDTIYMFTFANGKGATFSEHEVLVFAGAKMTNNFYNAVKAAFQNKEYNIKFTESGIDIAVSRGSSKGTVMISVENGFCLLTEKQVDKTFGK